MFTKEIDREIRKVEQELEELRLEFSLKVILRLS
jgi:hypothetical protein